MNRKKKQSKTNDVKKIDRNQRKTISHGIY